MKTSEIFEMVDELRMQIPYAARNAIACRLLKGEEMEIDEFDDCNFEGLTLKISKSADYSCSKCIFDKCKALGMVGYMCDVCTTSDNIDADNIENYFHYFKKTK